MLDEKAKIHWLRIEKPTILSQHYKKDGHNIAWKVTQTGRIGIRFRSDEQGVPLIVLYREISYQINTNIPKIDVSQLRVEDAREVRIIGTLFPGLNPGCDEHEQLITEITKLASDQYIEEKDTSIILRSILRWAINNDRCVANDIRNNFTSAASDDTILGEDGGYNKE